MINVLTHENVILKISLDKLRHNIQHSIDLCKAKSIDLVVVSKSICADQKIIDVINEFPIKTIADSRIANFAKMKTDKNKLLIRPTAPKEAYDLIRYCDISCQSNLDSLKAIGDMCVRENTTHEILLMIDMGDLRDGLVFTDSEQILKVARFVHEHPRLRLVGVATNYNCFYGLQPNNNNMNHFGKIHDLILNAGLYDTDSPIVSGGNSSSITILNDTSKYTLDPVITDLRLGEVIVTGRDSHDKAIIDNYYSDVFVLEVPIIEIYEKPVNLGDVPEGAAVSDSRMRRAVLSIGRQDIYFEEMVPLDTRVKLLGASSDMAVLDIGDCDYKVGDKMRFGLIYDALMTLYAGTFVKFIYED